jgi:hypothetical protein
VAGALLIGSGFVSAADATPLSKPEVVKLIRKNVQERRLLAVVRELGIDFKMTAEITDELRAAGATPTLVQALQALAWGEGTVAPGGSPPGLLPSAPAPAGAAPPASSVAVAPSPPAPAPAAATASVPSVAAAPVPAPAPAAAPPPAPTPPATATRPVSSEAEEPREETKPGHPLEPPPAAALPKGAAETMAALIPGPPPPPPPPIASPARVPVMTTALPPAGIPAPAPTAPASEAPPAAEAPSRWELVRPLLEKAQTLATEGDIRGAQTLVVRAMEIDPGEPQVWKAFKGIEADLLARAETFLADGQLPRALREFQFVIRANPESALGHNGVGLALLQLKNYDEAVAAFERALSLDSANARYRQALTRARSLQRASKALERTGQENLKEMLGDQPGKKKGP